MENNINIDKIIILPGNECIDTEYISWYGWLRD